MNMLKRLLIIILFTTISWCQSNALEHVSVRLAWKHQFEFAGFYVAKEKGFYKEVGLDVEFKEYDPKIDTVKEVLSGASTYGLFSSQLIIKRLSGEKVVNLASYFKQNALVLITKPDIKSIDDLKGKRVMATENELSHTSLATILHNHNLSIDDLHVTPHAFDTNAFESGEVDAISAFISNEPFILDQKNIPYSILNPADEGVYSYDLELFTSERETFSHPLRTKKFIDATRKGWEYALSHKKEIVDLIYEKYSQRKSKEALLYEAKVTEKLIKANLYPIGEVVPELVRLNTNMYVQLGMVNPNWNLEGFIFDPEHKKISLTDTERIYLINKKKITICIDPNWMPFEKVESGKHIGISKEYTDIIASKIHTPITVVPTKTWMESLVFSKARKCDILSSAMETPSRKTYLNFTTPYFDLPLVIATTNDKFFIADTKELIGKKIGLIRGYAFKELLKEKYPGIQFIEVTNITEGLEDVVSGKTFGYIDNLTTLGYEIQKNFPGILKITGRFDGKWELRYGVRNDEPILLAVMNKAIASIDEKTKQQITNQWINVKYEQGSDYKLLWKISVLFVIIIILLLAGYYLSKQYNKKLEKIVMQKVEELRKKDEILIIRSRMATMGEVISLISHQWKQPLNAISSALMGIEVKIASRELNFDDKNDRDKFLDFLKTKHDNIQEYTQFLSTTIDNFRNFLNPNKKIKEETSLTEPIESALYILETTLHDNNIEIKKEFHTDDTLYLYKNEIIQVILNILQNSLDNFIQKHTINPKIIINTSVKSDKYMIKICDNGGGIPEEIHCQIFEPYFTTKDNKNGSGLGLYMSKVIIEDHHHGTLTIHNATDGTCFEIIFNLE